MDTNLYTPEVSAGLDNKRRDARGRKYGGPRRLTYDCGYAKLGKTLNRVCCSMGFKLGPNTKDGTMPLLSVLRGRTSTKCGACTYFTGPSRELNLDEILEEIQNAVNRS